MATFHPHDDLATQIMAIAVWFVQQVKPGARWDYKLLTPDERYDPYGNFNFAAVGQTLGFSLETLQRAAGWVNYHWQHAPDSVNAPGFITGLIQILISHGGEPPHGDSEADYKMIAIGFNYAKERAEGKCK